MQPLFRLLGNACKREEKYFGILVGDLCKISNGENIKVGITWPRQSQRLSSVILSNSILKDLKPADGDSVIVSKLDRRYSEGTI